ncbi:hypothetical protein BRADI_3g07752v3 [Brachypodium distachyon]|uniref:Uncharacterized protein n=1 Tax=Brachypodium distachyon TaxID=15368 RepID=A0A2K2CVT9_BRADI|nr:hypothetical protein BRADI_3g07752v3 [Brachypodium distachyon]
MATDGSHSQSTLEKTRKKNRVSNVNMNEASVLFRREYFPDLNLNICLDEMYESTTYCNTCIELSVFRQLNYMNLVLPKTEQCNQIVALTIC